MAYDHDSSSTARGLSELLPSNSSIPIHPSRPRRYRKIFSPQTPPPTRRAPRQKVWLHIVAQVAQLLMHFQPSCPARQPHHSWLQPRSRQRQCAPLPRDRSTPRSSSCSKASRFVRAVLRGGAIPSRGCTSRCAHLNAPVRRWRTPGAETITGWVLLCSLRSRCCHVCVSFGMSPFQVGHQHPCSFHAHQKDTRYDPHDHVM